MTADSELLVMFFKITFPAAIGKTYLICIFMMYIMLKSFLCMAFSF